jgi:tetratricopeptide (TPR) repeat protein
VADQRRIEELEQRLRNDPASIAFAHLGEEYRRAGRIKDAIATCRAGLARHPGYLSARVTLGRALLELGELDAAQHELNEVRRVAPENLAAIRGLAEVHRRRGELSEALEQYRSAFELAQNDPGIDQIVKDLRKQIEPARGVAGPAASRPKATPQPAVVPRPAPQSGKAEQRVPLGADAPPARLTPLSIEPPPAVSTAPAMPPRPAGSVRVTPPPPVQARPTPQPEDPETVRTKRIVLLLERWIEGIVADRRSRIYGASAV